MKNDITTNRFDIAKADKGEKLVIFTQEELKQNNT
jgi:hypothetical protein